MPVAMSDAVVPQSNESTTQPAAISLPVTGHGLALTILATVAVIFALEWAQSFVISLLVGILFAYTLNPLVVWLARVKIPRRGGRHPGHGGGGGSRSFWAVSPCAARCRPSSNNCRRR
jgi:hypothetical protein